VINHTHLVLSSSRCHLQRIMMAEQASQYLKADSPETSVPYQN
jgi:hypothetical protein